VVTNSEVVGVADVDLATSGVDSLFAVDTVVTSEGMVASGEIVCVGVISAAVVTTMTTLCAVLSGLLVVGLSANVEVAMDLDFVEVNCSDVAPLSADFAATVVADATKLRFSSESSVVKTVRPRSAVSPKLVAMVDFSSVIRLVNEEISLRLVEAVALKGDVASRSSDVLVNCALMLNLRK